MHPWFFSMGLLHFGQPLVLARIQFRFSDSALFFTSHFFTVRQSTCEHETPVYIHSREEQMVIKLRNGS